VLVDRSQTRLELGIAQVRAMADSKALAVRIGAGPRLPFHSGAFGLVLEELHLPQARTPRNFEPNELARVCAGELVVSANNRLGYKRSAGRRADFRVPSPFAFVAGALIPAHGERSLRGYRAWLRRGGMSDVRAFALYPHQSDFTHLVALDGGGPRLMIGPKERRNQAKMIATRLGLFPWLTPSFALIARCKSGSRAKTRLERVLQEISRRTGEPLPEAEYVHATRGNTTLVMTCVQGAASGDSRGRWAVHIPLSRQQEDQLLKHQSRLSLIRERFPALKVPQPLWIGRAAGLTVACERRLDGLTAPQYTGDHAIAARMFADAARDFAGLTMRPARAFDVQDFERLVVSRFELVARFAAVPDTIRNLTVLCERLRAELVGASFPLVLQHADLRSKHVQLSADGSVLGYLDWGSSELEDLPYFDLLHLIVHERKHEADLTAAAAWAIVRERKELREHEQRALDDYSDRIGLDQRVRRAIEDMYPVLVAAMAERNWDYSRPRWLSRQFGL
ncbi:MAG: phosphotransferase, partial [Planctomycetota bacterium]